MKTYEGGCHCGAVRYEVELDLPVRAEDGSVAPGSVIECNCSHCYSKGLLLAFVPETKFTLLKGEKDLTEYRFNTEKIAHLSCKHCGVQSFGRGQRSDGTPTVSINVRCLDGVDEHDLVLTPYDGKDK
jgi:hypothetical protein